MNTGGQAAQPGPNSPARIWYQSFVDPTEERPYIARLEEYLTGYADPYVCFKVHGISPPPTAI